MTFVSDEQLDRVDRAIFGPLETVFGAVKDRDKRVRAYAEALVDRRTEVLDKAYRYIRDHGKRFPPVSEILDVCQMVDRANEARTGDVNISAEQSKIFKEELLPEIHRKFGVVGTGERFMDYKQVCDDARRLAWQRAYHRASDPAAQDLDKWEEWFREVLNNA